MTLQWPLDGAGDRQDRWYVELSRLRVEAYADSMATKLAVSQFSVLRYSKATRFAVSGRTKERPSVIVGRKKTVFSPIGAYAQRNRT